MSSTPEPDPGNAGAGSEAVAVCGTRVGESFFIVFEEVELLLYRGIAMTIAGSDSGGGAGIQADLKTFAALRVFGTSAIAAVTVQNSIGVTDIQRISPDIVRGQIDRVASDFPIGAFKTGMLGDAQTVRIVAETLKNLSVKWLVVDPVMVAQSGDRLTTSDTEEGIARYLIPIASLITPNLPEAERLLGWREQRIKTAGDMETAAVELARLGCRGVLVKGGHLPKETRRMVDVLYWEGAIHRLTSDRLSSNNNHGTGCTLSAAIVAELAAGADMVLAVNRARTYLRGAMRNGFQPGAGVGCLGHAVRAHWIDPAPTVLIDE